MVLAQIDFESTQDDSDSLSAPCPCPGLLLSFLSLYMPLLFYIFVPAFVCIVSLVLVPVFILVMMPAVVADLIDSASGGVLCFASVLC